LLKCPTQFPSWKNLFMDTVLEKNVHTNTDGIYGHFTHVLGDFSLHAQLNAPGRGVTALFGHSGSGKTTLLRCIAGLERAPQGELWINGECWQNEKFFIPIHQRELGYVFQEASLFAHLTVRRNLEYGMKRIPTSARRVAFDDVVALLGLSAMLERKPGKLSGGERQRVAIGRALLTSPKLLLMDEPLAALDALSKEDILPYLEALHEELSIPVLYITHSLPEVMRLADYLVMLAGGRVIAQGSLEEMLGRLDLPLLHSEEAGSVISAQVIAHEEEFYLSHLKFCGGYLRIPQVRLAIGEKARVRILARDVSLALDHDTRSSILNIFPATVLAQTSDNKGRMLVKLDIDGCVLVARITLKSATLLELTPGMSLYAQVKAVALV
jgi:molybdate transport system ATP-binding protein